MKMRGFMLLEFNSRKLLTGANIVKYYLRYLGYIAKLHSVSTNGMVYLINTVYKTIKYGS